MIKIKKIRVPLNKGDIVILRSLIRSLNASFPLDYFVAKIELDEIYIKKRLFRQPNVIIYINLYLRQ